MAHAEICPICGGEGTLAKPDPKYAGAEIGCNGCGGTGWITIQDLSPHIPIVDTIARQPK